MTSIYMHDPSKTHTFFTKLLVLDSKIIHKDYQDLIDKNVVFIQVLTKTDWSTILVFDDNCGNLFQSHVDL